jgi:DNA-binding NarL/FixJ family response regulator
MPLTVLIVDDHAGFRSFARALLEAEGFKVVGEAPDAAAALTGARTLTPELVLLDIRLPDIDGLELAEQLANEDNPPAVVLISSRDAADYGSRLRRTPAKGFIPKSDLSGPRLNALLRTLDEA